MREDTLVQVCSNILITTYLASSAAPAFPTVAHHEPRGEVFAAVAVASEQQPVEMKLEQLGQSLGGQKFEFVCPKQRAVEFLNPYKIECFIVFCVIGHFQNCQGLFPSDNKIILNVATRCPEKTN